MERNNNNRRFREYIYIYGECELAQWAKPPGLLSLTKYQRDYLLPDTRSHPGCNVGIVGSHILGVIVFGAGIRGRL